MQHNLLTDSRSRLGRLWRLILLGAACSTSPALATTDGGLLAACDDPASTPECRYYVVGFLDGALLTDTAIVDSLAKTETSAFFERAYRTRVGTMRGPVPATALAEFCLPEGLSVDAAADRVVQAIAASRSTAPSLQDAVYTTVKRLFPCKES
ncbi:MAG: Rap1a/Tai family immunity protein [Pseudomonadales bacterium]